MQHIVNLELSTLTPVHVGTGTWLQPEFDFLPFPHEACLALVDEGKVLSLVGEDGLSDWVNTIEKGEPLTRWLESRVEKLTSDTVANRVIKTPEKIPTGSNVKAQLRLASPTQACIPGSSIKGSVRTVIFNDQVVKLARFTKDIRKLQNKGYKGPSFSDRQVNAEIFGRKGRENHRKGGFDLDANRDFMRVIRFSDFLFGGDTECRTIEIVNRYRDGWGIKKEETAYLECIPQGKIGTGRFQVPVSLLTQLDRHRFKRNQFKSDKINRNRRYTDIKVLFQLINDFTERLVEKEITFWEEEDNPSVIGSYSDRLRDILTEIQQARKANSCVLRVGGGSGWTFMTGGWLKKAELVTDNAWYDLRENIQGYDYPDHIPTPKTRKLLAGGIPLGFVKLMPI